MHWMKKPTHAQWELDHCLLVSGERALCYKKQWRNPPCSLLPVHIFWFPRCDSLPRWKRHSPVASQGISFFLQCCSLQIQKSDHLSWSSDLATTLCLCQFYMNVFVRAASAFAERALPFPSLSRFCPSRLFKFSIRRLQSWLLACSAPLLAGHLIIALTWNI